MATLQTLLDDLNDRLNDANNAAGAGEAKKIRWINHGINAMWPKIYKDVSETIALVADDYEYTLGAGFNNGHVYRVEAENSNGRFYPIDDYIIDKRDSKVLSFRSLPEAAGQDIRVTGITRLSALSATSDTYDGPLGTEELPVLYAMGIAAGRPLDDRLVHTRYSTTAAQNGVDVNEMMNSSQFWFAQFELLLERLEMPWPTSGL